MGAALLVQNRLSPISDCIFLYRILEMTPKLVSQALDGDLDGHLKRGDNIGRTPVRTAKKRVWPLKRGSRHVIEV